MCKVYTGYCGTSEIEHGLCACTVDNPLAKARGLSLRTGAQPMLYLPLVSSMHRKRFNVYVNCNKRFTIFKLSAFELNILKFSDAIVSIPVCLFHFFIGL